MDSSLRRRNAQTLYVCDDEAWAPADGTNAAPCNDRESGTSRWRLSKMLHQLGQWAKGLAGDLLQRIRDVLAQTRAARICRLGSVIEG